MSSTSNSFHSLSRLNNRQIEVATWIILAMLACVYPIAHLLSAGIPITVSNFILFHYEFVFLSVFLILLPILFRLIFGFFPLEYIRVKKKIKTGIIVENKSDSPITLTYTEPDIPTEDYRKVCIKESKAIAERIFTRSGVYLLSGILTALAGIMIFYSPLFVHSSPSSATITQRLLDYLPRFGSLFFIEFIAIFFLRQFRIMHEEYRYYEAIKRKRQDNLNVLSLLDEHKDNIEIIKIIVQLYSEETAIGKIKKDETTQMLETQKILNQQSDILGKMVDVLKLTKEK